MNAGVINSWASVVCDVWWIKSYGVIRSTDDMNGRHHPSTSSPTLNSAVAILFGFLDLFFSFISQVEHEKCEPVLFIRCESIRWTLLGGGRWNRKTEAKRIKNERQKDRKMRRRTGNEKWVRIIFLADGRLVLGRGQKCFSTLSLSALTALVSFWKFLSFVRFCHDFWDWINPFFWDRCCVFFLLAASTCRLPALVQRKYVRPLLLISQSDNKKKKRISKQRIESIHIHEREREQAARQTLQSSSSVSDTSHSYRHNSSTWVHQTLIHSKGIELMCSTTSLVSNCFLCLSSGRLHSNKSETE